MISMTAMIMATSGCNNFLIFSEEEEDEEMVARETATVLASTAWHTSFFKHISQVNLIFTFIIIEIEAEVLSYLLSCLEGYFYSTPTVSMVQCLYKDHSSNLFAFGSHKVAF